MSFTDVPERLAKLSPLAAFALTLTASVLAIGVGWGFSQATLSTQTALLSDMRAEQRQLVLDVRGMLSEIASAKATLGANDHRISRIENRLERVGR